MVTAGVRGPPMTACSTKVQNMAYMNVMIGSNMKTNRDCSYNIVDSIESIVFARYSLFT